MIKLTPIGRGLWALDSGQDRIYLEKWQMEDLRQLLARELDHCECLDVLMAQLRRYCLYWGPAPGGVSSQSAPPSVTEEGQGPNGD